MQTILSWSVIFIWAVSGWGQDQNVRSPVPASAIRSGSTNLPHAAYVDRLLADGRKIVPYVEQTPLSIADIGMLVARYRDTSSVTNKWGITASLAYRGDERVRQGEWGRDEPAERAIRLRL